jgi:uncharacterized Ntn-hydrolase superfamily protein
MTFSIAARCAATGRFAVAVASSSPAVAARCAHLRADVGAVTTQNITDPRLGPRGLDLLALGVAAGPACEALRRGAPHPEYRQLTLIDRNGETAVFSGEHVLGVHAEARGQDVVSAGNLLADPGVPQGIVAAFETTPGDLGDRVIAAMRAGLAAGGEAGPIRLADRRSPRRLARGSDHGTGIALGRLEAADGGLRYPRAGSFSCALLRGAGGRVDAGPLCSLASELLNQR